MRRYTVLLTPDDDGSYTVEVPALPGCISSGFTIDEAIANAQDAIRLFLESLAEAGKPLPEDTVVVTSVEVEAA